MDVIRSIPQSVKGNFIVLFLALVITTGCSQVTELFSEEEVAQQEVIAVNEITKYEGEMSKVVPFVYTTKRELALTFNGMGDKQTMELLLDELDKAKIKATFFLPGMRVAEEPGLANQIIAQGHEIENNTLKRLDLTALSYEEIYKEIQLTNDIFEETTGITPKYVRTKSGEYNDDVRLATAHAGQEAVIYYSSNPQDWDMKSAEEIADYIEKYITRGGIITLNTDINPEIIKAIPLISEAVSHVGYELVTLEKLIEGGSERKPLESIPGYDAAKINEDYDGKSYQLMDHFETAEKVVALTFDDWGTDYKVTQIMDILSAHEVKATFFLRANGVEANPNLARALVEEGHDVANHTYTHPVITKITPEELQQEVVKAHRVLTEAIQKQPVMLFRPPTGEIDAKSAEIVAATGYKKMLLYDVTTLDWDVSNDAEDILSTIRKDTKQGSIILLHLMDELHTAEALPQVLEELKNKGYTFVKLADVLDM